MIGKILSGIFNLIMGLVSLILAPIDAMIMQIMPASFNDMINYVGNFFVMLGMHLGWVLSAIGLHVNIIQIIVMYYTFKLTLKPMVYVFKEILNWYNALKP